MQPEIFFLPHPPISFIRSSYLVWSQINLPWQTRCRTNATAFREKDRVVKITGEAYFEVAANQERPFNDVLRRMSGWYTKKKCRVLYSAGK
ncbi:hypothetical protein [Chitinophaga sp.]|uniref:hypothetical protein n=1 Tax=Chitinophaga sp. TaxID=1869181 RepID=UPI002F95EE43